MTKQQLALFKTFFNGLSPEIQILALNAFNDLADLHLDQCDQKQYAIARDLEDFLMEAENLHNIKLMALPDK